MVGKKWKGEESWRGGGRWLERRRRVGEEEEGWRRGGLETRRRRYSQRHFTTRLLVAKSLRPLRPVAEVCATDMNPCVILLTKSPILRNNHCGQNYSMKSLSLKVIIQWMQQNIDIS